MQLKKWVTLFLLWHVSVHVHYAHIFVLNDAHQAISESVSLYIYIDAVLNMSEHESEN